VKRAARFARVAGEPIAVESRGMRKLLDWTGCTVRALWVCLISGRRRKEDRWWVRAETSTVVRRGSVSSAESVRGQKRSA
jgi:hypothetical protein